MKLLDADVAGPIEMGGTDKQGGFSASPAYPIYEDGKYPAAYIEFEPPRASLPNLNDTIRALQSGTRNSAPPIVLPGGARYRPAPAALEAQHKANLVRRENKRTEDQMSLLPWRMYQFGSPVLRSSAECRRRFEASHQPAWEIIDEFERDIGKAIERETPDGQWPEPRRPFPPGVTSIATQEGGIYYDPDSSPFRPLLDPLTHRMTFRERHRIAKQGLTLRRPSLASLAFCVGVTMYAGVLMHGGSILTVGLAVGLLGFAGFRRQLALKNDNGPRD